MVLFLQFYIAVAIAYLVGTVTGMNHKDYYELDKILTGGIDLREQNRVLMTIGLLIGVMLWPISFIKKCFNKEWKEHQKEVDANPKAKAVSNCMRTTRRVFLIVELIIMILVNYIAL